MRFVTTVALAIAHRHRVIPHWVIYSHMFLNGLNNKRLIRLALQSRISICRAFHSSTPRAVLYPNPNLEVRHGIASPGTIATYRLSWLISLHLDSLKAHSCQGPNYCSWFLRWVYFLSFLYKKYDLSINTFVTRTLAGAVHVIRSLPLSKSWQMNHTNQVLHVYHLIWWRLIPIPKLVKLWERCTRYYKLFSQLSALYWSDCSQLDPRIAYCNRIS